VLLVVCASVFFSVMNGTMVNVALPLIGAEYRVDAARLGWIATGYLLIFGVAGPFYGRLADRYCTRRMFVIGLGVFALGSLLSAIAPGYPALLGARLVQAAGAAAIPGLGMALISRAYPPERRGGAIGFVSATVGTASAIGPMVSGVVVGALSWHYIFVLSALAGGLIPAVLRVAPRCEPGSDEGFDFLGGALLALTIGGALLAVTEGSRGGALAPVALGVAVVAAAGLTLRQRTTHSPFLPRDLVRNRRYLALLGISFSAMAASLAAIIGLPLLLAETARLTPLQIGLALMPGALALAVMGPVSGRLADRLGGRRPIRAGLAIMLLGGVALSAGAGAPVWAVALFNGVLGLGFAFVNSPLTAMVSLVVPSDRLASGLAINSMSYFLGGGFGTALFSAVVTARGGAVEALNPLHTGQAGAFSDAFLLLLLPVALALLLSLALPAESSRPAVAKPAPTPVPAEGTARR
jgi:EmrB/QacA subfamily drug resistance transporter